TASHAVPGRPGDSSRGQRASQGLSRRYRCPMQAAEIRDSGALLGSALSEVAEIARDVHKAVAKRLFTLLGETAAPVRLTHDAISAVAYGSALVGVKAIPAAVGAGASVFRDPSAESIDTDPRAHFTLSALSGFWGDRL